MRKISNSDKGLGFVISFIYVYSNISRLFCWRWFVYLYRFTICSGVVGLIQLWLVYRSFGHLSVFSKYDNLLRKSLV